MDEPTVIEVTEETIGGDQRPFMAKVISGRGAGYWDLGKTRAEAIGMLILSCKYELNIQVREG